MTENNIKYAIEALMFSSDKPLTLEQFKNALDIQSREEISSAIKELQQEYENFNRGMRIVEIAGGFQMVASVNFSSFLRKLYKDKKIERLSKPALETLAIIAYKQPITKMEIESLRGVNIDGVMDSLTDKDLIRISGRKKTAGRPFVYGTTKRFLEYFGLKSLDELPKMEKFSSLIENSQENTDTQDIEEVANTEGQNANQGTSQ